MKREAYWDNIKGILILLVVVTHFMQLKEDILSDLYQAVYLFHMPFFIFICGVFHKNTQIKDRVLSLVLIGTVYNIVLILVDNIWLKQEQMFYIFKATKIPWFVYAIALCTVITYFIKDYNKWMILSISFLIGIMACYDVSVLDNYVVAKTLCWYPFYYLGYILDRKKIEKVTSINVVRFAGLSIIVLYILFICLNVGEKFSIANYTFLFSGQKAYPSLSIYWCIIKILYYIAVIIISFSIMCVISKRNIRFLSYLGRNSMRVYFWHIPIRSIVYATGFQEYAYMTIQGIIVYTLLTVILTLVLSTKIFGFPTDYIIKYTKGSGNE